MLKRSGLAGLILASMATGSLAQTTSPPPTTPPVTPTPTPQIENFGAKPSPHLGIYENNTQMTLLRMSMQYGDRPGVTPEQLRRARHAAALIKANQCQDAFNLALEDHDYRLAGNIAVACKARFRQ